MSIIDPNTGQPFVENGGNPFAPPTIESYPPLSGEEFEAMRNMAAQSLAQGHNPATPVALALQAMCQIVRLIESLDKSLESTANAFAEMEPIASRQALHGKHEQDRADAEAWLLKYAHILNPTHTNTPAKDDGDD